MSSLRLIVLAAALAVAGSAQTIDVQWGYRTSASASPTFINPNANIPFPNVQLGASGTLTFIINNRGTTPLTITRAAVTGEGFTGGTTASTTVGASSTALIDLTFRPTKPGSASGTLNVSVAAVGGQTVNASFFLTGSALAPDIITSYILNPSGNQTAIGNGDTLRFNLTNLNETSTATFIITNRGNGKASLREVSVSGEAFRLGGLPLLPSDINAERDVRFTISFLPTTRAPYRETLRIVVDTTTYVILLEGQGSGAEYTYTVISDSTTTEVPAGGTITLPGANVSSTSTVRVRATNTGNANGRLNVLEVSGTGFTLAGGPPLPLTVLAGASFEFNINYRPTETGRQTGRLRVENVFFDLVGTGIGARLEFSATNEAGSVTVPNGGTFNFPNTQVGAKSQAEIRIQNTGNAPTSVNSISVAGNNFQLSQDLQLPARLNPDESVAFRVTFAPEAVGSLTGTIQIDDFRIQIRGAGTPPAPIPQVTITTSAENAQALQQPTVRLTLASPYAQPITGRLTLTFNSETFTDDPAIQFATGGRTIDFRIPENTTEAIFTDGSRQIPFQTGTVAGTIAVGATLTVATVSVTPSPAPSKSLAVAQAEPQITSVQVANRTSGGMDLIITGYSTARSVTTLTMQFTATGGSQLQTPSLTQNVEAQFTTWFQNTASRAFGSQFAATLRLNGTGDLNNLQSITVTAANAKGTSRPVSVNLRQDTP